MTVAELQHALAGLPDDADVMLLIEGRDGYFEVGCNGVAGVALRHGRPVVTLTTAQP